jgi:Uncharacterized protein conserved in bacteria
MFVKNSVLPKLENPRLVVKKKDRTLEVFDGERLVKTYPIVLGFSPAGDKRIEGDGRTPEGDFYVFTKNPKSKFYLSLGVSYPNAEAARRGLSENLITREEYDAIMKAISEKRMPPQKTALGGEIYIHGGGIEGDWTKGCMALRNEEMREIFEAIPIGAPVKIEP